MSSKKKILLTDKGVQALQEKLEKLEREYAEVSRGKMEAAEQGGNLWHDNPAFEEVEQRQIMLARMIAETQETLKNAEVVSAHTRVGGGKYMEVGSVAEIKLGSGTARTVRLGGGAESDPAGGVVSYLSPLGQALLGAKEGDERTYTVNGKALSLTVVRIKTSDEKER